MTPLTSIPLLQQLYARPRLSGSAVLGILLYILLPSALALTTRLLIAWDGSITLYLWLVIRLSSSANPAKISLRASQEDEGKLIMLLLLLLATAASIGAIVLQLPLLQQTSPPLSYLYIGLTLFTLFISWCFIHTLLALHYAHEYYIGHPDCHKQGLRFPDEPDPNYWDFVYFSFTLGTSAQTSDVEVTSRLLRKIVIFHSIGAFFFNTTIIALMVNIGSQFF